MKNSLFLALSTLAFGLGINALPASAADAVMEKRAQVCVFVGTDADFKGLTQNQCAAPGVCWEESSSFEDQISSIGADHGHCRAFFDRGCSDNEGHFDFGNPGIADLSKYGDGKSNDRISSWSCIE
ncbi:hypothetical protein PG994_000836 [Apiospora phragmitis]|uniref:Uncharacterized protein n=1 Tax=Apiospora phragmitis TaxID=2905665 RepID=A0ABR1X7E8_9PEZI